MSSSYAPFRPRFVERFAQVMVDSGMPRISSRIFVALLASDDGRLAEAVEFFRFLQAELHLMTQRWNEHRAAVAAAGVSKPDSVEGG
jgi:hypothetical protein